MRDVTDLAVGTAVTSGQDTYQARSGLSEYEDLGYMSSATTEFAASTTLQNATDDFTVSRIVQNLEANAAQYTWSVSRIKVVALPSRPADIRCTSLVVNALKVNDFFEHLSEFCGRILWLEHFSQRVRSSLPLA